MTHRDRIRTQVGAVKSETQSLLKRLRAERLEKARQRRPGDTHAARCADMVAEPEREATAGAFAAGPGVDRFFAGQPPLDQPVATPPQSLSADDVQRSPAKPASQVCAGLRIGLEPITVRGTEGRRQPEPRLLPVEVQEGHRKMRSALPVLETGAGAARLPARAPVRAAARTSGTTRNVDPGLLELQPIYGGGVTLKVPMPVGIRPRAEAPKEVEASAPKRETADGIRSIAEAAAPLSAIAAIGPGLAWKLHNLGVLTLEDLARADANALRNGLGPLGSLVSLDSWIAEAKSLLASRNGSSC